MRLTPDTARLTARALVRAAAVLVPIGVAANVALAMATTERGALEAALDRPLGPLALALGLAVVPWATNTLRLQLWASFVGHPLGFGSALRVVLGGLLGSAVTPTGSGGAALKWALLARRGVPPGQAGTLLLVETAENAAFAVVAVPLALALAVAEAPAVTAALSTVGADLGPALVVGLLAAAGLAGLAWAGARGVLGRPARGLVVRTRRAARRPVRDGRRVLALVARRGKGRLALGVGLAAVQWTARYSVAAAVLAFLGVPVGPVLSWLLQWTLFTLTNAVPTPGAAGGAEAAFAALYAPFVPTAALGLATATWRLVLFYLPLAVAALAFLGLGRASASSRPAPA